MDFIIIAKSETKSNSVPLLKILYGHFQSELEKNNNKITLASSNSYSRRIRG